MCSSPKVQADLRDVCKALEDLKRKSESQATKCKAEASEWNAAARDLVEVVSGSTHLVLRCCEAMSNAARSTRAKRKR